MTTAPSTPDLEEQEPTSGPEEGPPDQEEALGTQSEVEVLGPCKLRIKAEVPHEKVTELLDRNYRDLISTLQIPGFRRGKVPRPLVEKRYGEEIEKDLKEALLNNSFIEVVKEKDLKVVGRPKFDQIHFQKEEPFRYLAEVEVQPEFELPEYKGIEAKEEKIPVTTVDIDHEIQHLQQRLGTLVPMEKEAAGAGDIIIASYKLLAGGEEVHAVKETAFKPETGLLDGLSIANLKEAFQARGQNDNLQLTARIPEDHFLEKFRGQEVAVELTVQDAKRLQLPDLNDDFARNFQCDSLGELRQKLEEILKERHKRMEEAKIEERILDQVAGGVQFDLPEGLLENQKKINKVQLQYDLIQMGRSKEEIEEELKKAEVPQEDEIRREMKRFFVLEKIAEKEKIFATEDDLQNRIQLLAETYHRRPDEILRELDQAGRLGELRVGIRHKKVKQFLREKASIVGS